MLWNFTGALTGAVMLEQEWVKCALDQTHTDVSTALLAAYFAQLHLRFCVALYDLGLDATAQP